MTLSEFYEMAYSTNASDTVAVYVFDSDETRDNYRRDPNYGGFMFTLQSEYKPAVFLTKKYANAKVQNFYAIGENRIDVVIDLEANNVG